MRLFKIADDLDSSLLDVPTEIRRYGDRTWAVYFGDELLCVTVYLRGARAVQALIERLQGELRRAKARESVSLALGQNNSADEQEFAFWSTNQKA